jgi:pimeloyl-ACP methyl ester carboxylesterase
MTYALIPRAGGSAWYWQRVVPLLPDAIAIDLPADDDSADLNAYASTVVEAVASAFFHDVPDAVREEALRQGEPRQSDTQFEQPWPPDRWPDVPTGVIAGADDRLFPLEFQRRVVRSRLGLELEAMPGGHLMALSRPEELASRILSAGGADGH